MKDAEAALATIVRGDEALGQFHREHMRADGSGFSRLSTTSLVNWLLEYTLQAGPDTAVHDLEQYLCATSFQCVFTVGIKGVTTTEAVPLADGVRLLPHSADVASFELRNRPPASTAALTTLVDFPKVLVTPQDVQRSTSDAAETVMTEAYEKLHIARMCIAIMLNSRVVETVRVSDTAPAVPRSGGRSASTAIEPANVAIRALTRQDVENITNLHGRLTALPRKLKDRLVVALYRWHSLFLKSGVSADFFIDLGIGLESVFVSEKAPEIGYRLAVRGARLLGGTTAESRMHTAKVLTTLYHARSQAVHSGRLLRKIPTSVAPSAGHLAKDGEEFLRKAIITMIYRGRDDWDELVFA